MMRAVFRSPVGLALALCLAACVDLNAVRGFSDLSVAASEPFEFIALDFQDSQRRSIDLGNDLELLPDEDLEGVLQVWRGLRAYLAALATLASDELVRYDAPIESLQADVRASGLVRPDVAEAHARVVATALEAATRFWRHRALRDAIRSSDADVQALVGCLVEFTRNYAGRLGEERQHLELFWEGLDPADAEAVAFALRERDGDLRRRAELAASCESLLEEIAHRHASLAANVDDLDGSEVVEMVQSYQSRIGEEYVELRRNRPTRTGGGRRLEVEGPPPTRTHEEGRP